MNSPMIGLQVASVIFGLMSLGQLTRLIASLEIMVGGYHIPFWVSVIAFPVLLGLSAWLWKLSCISDK